MRLRWVCASGIVLASRQVLEAERLAARRRHCSLSHRAARHLLLHPSQNFFLPRLTQGVELSLDTEAMGKKIQTLEDSKSLKSRLIPYFGAQGLNTLLALGQQCFLTFAVVAN